MWEVGPSQVFRVEMIWFGPSGLLRSTLQGVVLGLEGRFMELILAMRSSTSLALESDV